MEVIKNIIWFVFLQSERLSSDVFFPFCQYLYICVGCLVLKAEGSNVNGNLPHTLIVRSYAFTSCLHEWVFK